MAPEEKEKRVEEEAEAAAEGEKKPYLAPELKKFAPVEDMTGSVS